MAARDSRLSVEDWIEAGYATIADDGLQALKIDRLCTRLGVTKGSFYWHFSDMAGYRSALIDNWAAHRDDNPGITDLPARQRLSAMVAGLVSPQHWRLERAMREWARTDAAVAAAVTAADRRVLRSVQQAFVELGFDAEDATLRAQTTFAAGIGFLHIAGSGTKPMSSRNRERFLELMVQRLSAARTSQRIVE